MKRKLSRQNILAWIALGGSAVALAIGCTFGIQRDLSAVPPSKVIEDDLCELQDYFDTMALGQAAPPTLVSTREIEKTVGKRAAGGMSRYAFETDFQLTNLRRVLQKNWDKIPDEVMRARKVFVEVRWAERASVKRVVTNRDAELAINDRKPAELWAVPYHVCLSELLYGAPLYRTRRDLLGLPALVAPSDAGVDLGLVDAVPGR
jgi:hypothetical protein